MKLTLPIILLGLFFMQCSKPDVLKQQFLNPPSTALPGVYWYFMDGNLDREEMTRDLESMKESGINHVIFLEVGIGVPRGQVDFMRDSWQELFVHAVREAERLDMRILLGAGPGWCGSGGPWVKPEESMQHLVFSETQVKGPGKISMVLPVPEQRRTPWHTMNDPFYKDVAVYAIPRSADPVIADINEKALYERYPYSSHPGVKTHLPAPAVFTEPEPARIVQPDQVIPVSKFMDEEGRLEWDAPAGEWIIVRMGIRVTGASTRPSPKPVIGLECNKLDTTAFKNHLKNYTDVLLEKTAPRKNGVGWTGFHIDSWESGSQNWTDGISEAFKKRRGYDPEPYLLTYTGRAVNSLELSERFLWDLRLTCQELLLENHAGYASDYAHKNGLELTIEPYDMNPAGDLDLGYYADVIMAEFWSKRFGFNTHYAVLEATSVSHITGRPVVGAEVFTSDNREAWQEYPWSMKDQSDWALAMGVNRFVYHTFAHKPLGDAYRPGMTMGPYGVHWDRGQTWWPMVHAYHTYVSRNSHMMQQGQAVSDILYLTPEGAPMIFYPPADALEKNGSIPDKKSYGFDGCSPKMFIEKAFVENGKIAFPGASSYQILVLPNIRTMTPELLNKISQLVENGATVMGIPPLKSPGLTNHPQCDEQVKNMALKIWGTLDIPAEINRIKYGQGTVLFGGDLAVSGDSVLYPDYQNTVDLLKEMGIHADFTSENNSIRYGHRKTGDRDIYFIANRTGEFQKVNCTFRATGEPELWIGTTGEIRKISHFTTENGLTTIPMEFFPHESFVVSFSGKTPPKPGEKSSSNFAPISKFKQIEGPWEVSFDPRWGGPEKIVFDKLQDWASHEMRGIKYYSGIAVYTKTFDMDDPGKGRVYLDLGIVHDMAEVTLNGKNVGVVWCAPWRIDISDVLKKGENRLEILVANRWINRLLGDRLEPDAQVRKVKFENGLLGGKEFTTGRYTFTIDAAMRSFHFTEPLPSGLIGPVSLQSASN